MSIEPPTNESEETWSKVAEEEDISKEKNLENSVSNEGNTIDSAVVSNVEHDQEDSGSLRRCTRTGVLINLDNARKRARKAGMAVKSSISRLDNLLREQCTDIVKLTASNDGLSMDMNDFKRFHEEVMDLLLLSSKDDQYGVEDQSLFDKIRESFLECVADVKTRISDLSQERQELLSQRTRISGKSRGSKLSSVSSTSSKQAAANAAALKEKMLSLRRKQDIERQQEELKQHQRELEWRIEQEQLQGEINAAEVLHQTLAGEPTKPMNACTSTTQMNQPAGSMNTNDTVTSVKVKSPCITQPASNTVHVTTTQTNQSVSYENSKIPSKTTKNPNQANPLNPNASTFALPSPPTQPVECPRPNMSQERIQRDTIEIQRQQVELMKRMTLPMPKPPVFNGDILAYPKWVLAFDALIDSEAVNPAHKLYYLGQYTGGKAQKMINGLLGLQSEDAYNRARTVLQERFGDPFKIYEAYNEKLKVWPVCSKGHELQEFSDFLVTVQETMKTVKYLEDFNTFAAIQELVARLPPYYSKKWLQSAKDIELSKGKYDFDDLVEFV